MIDITTRLHQAIHMESARIAPQTSEAIEMLKLALAEINRLDNQLMIIRNAVHEAERDYPIEWSLGVLTSKEKRNV